MKIIELVISPTGETRLETKGFTGSSCVDASRFLEQALGQIESQELTSAYHQTSTTQNNELRESS